MDRASRLGHGTSSNCSGSGILKATGKSIYGLKTNVGSPKLRGVRLTPRRVPVVRDADAENVVHITISMIDIAREALLCEGGPAMLSVEPRVNPIFPHQVPGVGAPREDEDALDLAIRRSPEEAWSGLRRYPMRSPERIYLLSKFVDFPPPLGDKALNYLIGELNIIQSCNKIPNKAVTQSLIRCHEKSIRRNPAETHRILSEYSDIVDLVVREWFGFESMEWIIRGLPCDMRSTKPPPFLLDTALKKCKDLFLLGVGGKIQTQFLKIAIKNSQSIPEDLVESMIIFEKMNIHNGRKNQDECRSILRRIAHTRPPEQVL